MHKVYKPKKGKNNIDMTLEELQQTVNKDFKLDTLDTNLKSLIS
ncbi:MAG: hypothetical protein CM15mP96_2370 [Gammaproteobacteria bacterium]|nr:MAG: hypothetical protein CM15mP96_2370 [Gammaproteobacteria bacterium]